MNFEVINDQQRIGLVCMGVRRYKIAYRVLLYCKQGDSKFVLC